MTGLRPALVALLAWAVHFFGAYGLMLALPDAPIVVWFTLGLGLACLAVLGVLLRSTPWNTAAVLAVLRSGIAIVWQSISALFGTKRKHASCKHHIHVRCARGCARSRTRGHEGSTATARGSRLRYGFAALS